MVPVRSSLVALAALAALATLSVLAGCEEPQPLPVAHFLEDEVALYGTLARCDQDRRKVDEAECRNARAAAERIAVIEERAVRRAREEAFESARAEYRAQLDRERDLRLRAEADAHAARLRTLVQPAGEATTEPGRPPDESPQSPDDPPREE